MKIQGRKSNADRFAASFALSKILGYNVRNYDGSWTEYGNTVGLPIVNVTGTVWQGK